MSNSGNPFSSTFFYPSYAIYSSYKEACYIPLCLPTKFLFHF
jgi:hypothetical protein